MKTKNRFKKWDRVNLYNPRVSKYGKKQFIIMSDKAVVMQYIKKGEEDKAPTEFVPHYAVLLNSKVKYIPVTELNLANPYVRVGDKVTYKDDVLGNVYTIVKIDVISKKAVLRYGNGEIDNVELNDVELIEDKWVEYCETQYKNVVIPKSTRQIKQKDIVAKKGLFSKLGINIFKSKDKKQNEEQGNE